MTAAVAGAVRGRPSRVRLAELHERAADHAVELAARQVEAVSLVAAIRFVARELEALAWSPEGDPRTVNAAARLRGIADQVERRWETVL